jgi:hypothetical protein
MKKIVFSALVYIMFVLVNIIAFILMEVFNIGYSIKYYEIFFPQIPFCVCIYLILLLVKSKTWKIFFLPAFLLILKIIIISINGYTPFIADSLMFFSMSFSLIFNVGQYYLELYLPQSMTSAIILHLLALSLYQSFVLFIVMKISEFHIKRKGIELNL